jgi:hypothetical protein
MKILKNNNIIYTDEQMDEIYTKLIEICNLEGLEFEEAYSEFEIPSVFVNFHFSSDKDATILHLLSVLNSGILNDTKTGKNLKQNFSKVIHFLIENGADINIQDATGKTPLHCALKSGNTENALYLLDNGANPHATDKQSRSILYYALLNAGVIGLELSKKLIQEYQVEITPAIRQKFGKDTFFIGLIDDCRQSKLMADVAVIKDTQQELSRQMSHLTEMLKIVLDRLPVLTGNAELKAAEQQTVSTLKSGMFK